MSDQNQPAENDTTRRPRSRKRQDVPPMISRITFVDSNDPTPRSTIQRHTAYHSNAQRQARRIASLRTTSRPRVLQFSMRAHSDTSTSAPTNVTSGDQDPMSPSTIGPLVMSPLDFAPRQTDGPDGGRLSREVSQSEIVSEEEEEASLMQYLLRSQCEHTHDHESLWEIVEFGRTNAACVQLLLAYALFLRAHDGQSTDAESDRERAGGCISSGRVLLLDRLRYLRTALTDESMQAVLLLIALTADFGNRAEIDTHRGALQQMLAVRGGQPVPGIIQRQLDALTQARSYHLTLSCNETCSAPFRFHQSYGERS